MPVRTWKTATIRLLLQHHISVILEHSVETYDSVPAAALFSNRNPAFALKADVMVVIIHISLQPLGR
jgi:hypothetical protein